MNLDLSRITWDKIETTNKLLCENSAAAHGRSSEGYEPAKQLWEQRPPVMVLRDALELARKCHKTAPFLNFNGNTFVAAIGFAVTGQIKLPAMQLAALKSFSGHYIAGTITPQEERALALLAAADGEPLKVGDQVQSLQGSMRGVVKEVLPDGNVWLRTPTMGTVKTAPDGLLKVSVSG